MLNRYFDFYHIQQLEIFSTHSESNDTTTTASLASCAVRVWWCFSIRWGAALSAPSIRTLKRSSQRTHYLYVYRVCVFVYAICWSLQDLNETFLAKSDAMTGRIIFWSAMPCKLFLKQKHTKQIRHCVYTDQNTNKKTDIHFGVRSQRVDWSPIHHNNKNWFATFDERLQQRVNL